MANRLELSDIFLSPHFGRSEPKCLIKAFDPMDAIEYGLGVERGWLIDLLSRTSKYSDLIWDDMNSDVYEHLMSSRMALLPEPDIVAKVESLLRHNFDECSMQERTHFLEALPFTDYTYTLLPVCMPEQMPLYTKVSGAQPVYEPLTIRSKLHPCFLIDKTAYYGTMHHPHTRNVLDDETYARVSFANVHGFNAVPMAWLGEDSPKYDNRPLVLAKDSLLDPSSSMPAISGVNQASDVNKQEFNLRAFKEKPKPETLKSLRPDKKSGEEPLRVLTPASKIAHAPMMLKSYEDIGVGTGIVDRAWLSKNTNS